MTDTAAEETITLPKLLTRVRDESGVNPMDVPIGEQCVWYGPPGGTDPLQLIQVRVQEPFRLFKSHTVLSIFHDDEEIRVYTMLSGKPDPTQPMLAAPRCTHLSKRGPVYFMEVMPIDAFVTAMASDWSLVAYDMTPVERARIEIGTYIRENAGKTIADLADDIESGEYEEQEDDDDEDDKTPPGPPSPPGAPNPGVS
jgi:hypothetical protein